MSPLHHLLPPALMCVVLAVPAAPQEAPPEPAGPSMLDLFARDATAFTALPWQREALGLSPTQTAALRGIAEDYQPIITDLYEEIRVLFENVGMLDPRGLDRLLLGSVSERVLRMAERPVLVVRAEAAVLPPATEPATPVSSART